MGIDLDLYRKLAGTYGVENSEQNAINEFVKQSNKIYDGTLSMYDILAPSNRGDDIIITLSDYTTKESRAVFNYNKQHSTSTMKIGEERCYLELGDGRNGNYILQVNTDELFIVAYKDINRFDFDDTVVRKCNVELKFFDDCGVLQTVNANIQGKTTDNDLSEGKYMTLTDGELSGMMQTNDITSKIKVGDEFIFGNMSKFKYRISFLNDFEYEGLTMMNLEKYEINQDVDNLELGIANYETRPTFTLSIAPTNTEISSGSTVQLEYSLLDKDNQEDDKKTILWTSSNEAIATVDENGLVTGVSNGSVTITATMECNDTVFDDVGFVITDTPSDNIEYSLTPSDESVLRSDTIVFEAIKTNNGTVVPETFTFSVDASTTANAEDYNFNVIDSTTFSVENLKEGDTLVILIVPDSDIGNSFTRSLDLIGYW